MFTFINVLVGDYLPRWAVLLLQLCDKVQWEYTVKVYHITDYVVWFVTGKQM